MSFEVKCFTGGTDMSEKVGSLLRLLEEFAPKQYAMDWDNVGLQVGGIEDPVSKVLVCLDVTEGVIDEAINNNIDFIISHHPIIFKPIKNIIKENPQGNLIHKAIKNNISIYCGHTNVDIAPGGLNDYLATKLGLQDTSILDVTMTEKLFKLVVFIPEEHQEAVADAIASEGAGHIGNYSNCSFRALGTGTFMALEGTNPFIGERGQLERVQEIRLETIVPEKRLKKVLEKMLDSHPYEEVAYDLYPLSLEGNKVGIGRIGSFREAIKLSILIEKIKLVLKLDSVKVVGDNDSSIKKLCIVNGSGAEYIKAAVMKGCDCLITGDVKYHEAQIALELGLKVIDAGHFETENIFIELMANYLEAKVKDSKLAVEIIKSNINVNPFRVL